MIIHLTSAASLDLTKVELIVECLKLSNGENIKNCFRSPNSMPRSRRYVMNQPRTFASGANVWPMCGKPCQREAVLINNEKLKQMFVWVKKGATKNEIKFYRNNIQLRGFIDMGKCQGNCKSRNNIINY